MSKLKLFISVSIIFCYLCPFSSCGFGETTSVAISDSTLNLDMPNNEKGNLSNKPSTEEGFFKTTMRQVVFPSDNSISGIGLVLTIENNAIEGYFILVSFLLSILITLPIKIISNGKWPITILSTNLLVLGLSIFYFLIIRSDTLLWGIWLLASLLVIRLVLEVKFRP